MIARRRLLLWGALAATIAASIWAGSIPKEGDEVAPSTRRAEALIVADRGGTPSPVRVASKADERVPLALPQRGPATEAAPDLFDAYSWAPPKSAAPEKAMPPPPPPLPFTFSGRIEIEGQPSFLLAEGPRTHIVPVGADVGVFRLESATESELTFIHIPTSGRVPMRIAP